jgi:arylsulfatase
LSQAIANELKRPNFVTIVIDDMGFSDLSYFGGEVSTLNLDQLVESGIALTNFYSAPTSTPSRAQFFTGKDR